MTTLVNTFVPEHLAGQRIDVVLAKVYPEYSRAQLSSWLKQGLIKINAQSMRPKDKVLGGEHIENNGVIEHQALVDQPEAIPLDIVFEDEELLIINKAAGLVVHPGAGNRQHTLVNALLHHEPRLQHLPRAGLIHRLDKETTGLLLIAKTLTTYNALVRQMQEREIHRKYLALVHGHLISGGRIETGFGRDPKNRLKMAVLNGGKIAITEYAIRKQYHILTLLDVSLHTGRTHQIRVHMTSIKHPIVGDPLYGGQARFPAKVEPHIHDALKQFKRQALHAMTLSFMHPKTKNILTFTAPMPHDFELLLGLLDENLELSMG